MAAAYPYNISGWVSKETGVQIDDAVRRGPSKAKLVRMALESYMKRYGKPGRGARAELHAGLDKALDNDPSIQAQIDALIFKATAKAGRRK